MSPFLWTVKSTRTLAGLFPPPGRGGTTSRTRRWARPFPLEGVFDVYGNDGWVNVGDHHDTPAFAVASILRRWDRMGRLR